MIKIQEPKKADIIFEAFGITKDRIDEIDITLNGKLKLMEICGVAITDAVLIKEIANCCNTNEEFATMVFVKSRKVANELFAQTQLQTFFEN